MVWTCLFKNYLLSFGPSVWSLLYEIIVSLLSSVWLVCGAMLEEEWRTYLVTENFWLVSMFNHGVLWSLQVYCLKDNDIISEFPSFNFLFNCCPALSLTLWRLSFLLKKTFFLMYWLKTFVDVMYLEILCGELLVHCPWVVKRLLISLKPGVWFSHSVTAFFFFSFSLCLKFFFFLSTVLWG